MEVSVVSTAVGGTLALVGAVLGAAFQWYTARSNQDSQFRLEAAKRQAALEDRERDEHRRRLLAAHQALSVIARRFSQTALDIDWRAGLTDKEYDKRYLQACEALDEARAICDLYYPEASDALEELHDQMNIFWGNFKEVLSLTELQEPYEKKQLFLSKAIEAANAIGAGARKAKNRLAGIAGRLVAGGGV
jgi:hypothetical protein